jgi:hypothetical protein
VALDTAHDLPPTPGTVYKWGQTVSLLGRHLVLLERD